MRIDVFPEDVFSKLTTRYIPWPTAALAAPLNPSEILLRHWVKTRSIFPGIRLSWVLSSLKMDKAIAYLSLVASTGKKIWVVDLRGAERNLDWPVILIAQALTFNRRAPFLHRGGLEGIAGRAGLHVSARRSFWAGAALMLTLEP